MSSPRAFSALIVGSCFAVMGCVADVEEPMPFEAGDIDVPLEEEGLGCLNGTVPSAFWNHTVQATLRTLATGPLVTGSGHLPNMPTMAALPATPAQWKVIKSAVECALTPSMSAKNPHTLEVYQGVAGLAPNWRIGALDGTGRRWVTACMIQKLNAFGMVVPILMVGNHNSIQVGASDEALYPFDESTAWADLFSSTIPLGGNNPAFYANVCSEGDLAGLCRDGSESTLNYRICGSAGGSSICGLNYLGYCSSACVPNGPYRICGGSAQTIRVKLQTGNCHD